MTWLKEDENQILKSRSIGEIKRSIIRCNTLDIKNSSFLYVQECVAEAISGYTKNQQLIDLRKKTIFRARKNENGEPWNRISDVWYNPEKERIGFGRANNPGEQVLYLASEMEIAALEIKSKCKDQLTVIECRTKDRNTLFPFIEFRLFGEDMFRKMKMNNTGYPIDIEAYLGRNNYLKNKMITEFMSSSFKRIISEQSEYKITASLANILWLEEDTDDSVFYPSIAANDIGYNIAFKPNIADERLYIARVYSVLVEEPISGVPKLRILKEGKVKEETGEFIWS